MLALATVTTNAIFARNPQIRFQWGYELRKIPDEKTSLMRKLGLEKPADSILENKYYEDAATLTECLEVSPKQILQMSREDLKQLYKKNARKNSNQLGAFNHQ